MIGATTKFIIEIAAVRGNGSNGGVCIPFVCGVVERRKRGGSTRALIAKEKLALGSVERAGLRIPAAALCFRATRPLTPAPSESGMRSSYFFSNNHTRRICLQENTLRLAAHSYSKSPNMSDKDIGGPYSANHPINTPQETSLTLPFQATMTSPSPKRPCKRSSTKSLPPKPPTRVRNPCPSPKKLAIC